MAIELQPVGLGSNLTNDRLKLLGSRAAKGTQEVTEAAPSCPIA